MDIYMLHSAVSFPVQQTQFLCENPAVEPTRIISNQRSTSDDCLLRFSRPLHMSRGPLTRSLSWLVGPSLARNSDSKMLPKPRRTLCHSKPAFQPAFFHRLYVYGAWAYKETWKNNSLGTISCGYSDQMTEGWGWYHYKIRGYNSFMLFARCGQPIFELSLTQSRGITLWMRKAHKRYALPLSMSCNLTGISHLC